MTRACADCRHSQYLGGLEFWCSRFDTYAATVRSDPDLCGRSAKRFERYIDPVPRPPRPPLMLRFWRWLGFAE